MKAPPPVPIGTSDFQQIRSEGKLYVDKSRFITQVLIDPARVLLLPRPRRFGKTTNLSTLAYFLAKSPEDRSGLFADLAVWGDPEARAHFQRYPVISLTFKDVKASTFAKCFADVSRLLAELYDQHNDLLTGGRLSEREAATFRAILERRADQSDYEWALRDLCRHLHARDNQPVVLLLDEYDTPLHAAYSHGYFDEAIALFRGILSGALKDNPHLFKSVLTGILRVAKESIFSDLNNINVFSLLHPRYATAFGFTEAEVAELAGRAGLTGSLDELRAWYNGYVFGEGTVIYNPWSVLSALDRGTCAPYWVDTSSNELIRELLLRATSEQSRELEEILRGGTIRKRLSENVVLREVHRDPAAVWSFLVFCGYLRAGAARLEDCVLMADLSVPNLEVRTVFTDLFRSWLEARLGGDREVELLGRAILAGDAEVCQALLSKLLVESASTFDLAGVPTMPPEQLYHVFVLGLLLHLQPRYLVRSNRESGFGRSDVMISPREPGQPGVVLELKVRRGRKTLTQVIAEGLEQLATRDYAAELRALGAAPIYELAVAFDGKAVRVQRREPPRARMRVSQGSGPKGPGRSTLGLVGVDAREQLRERAEIGDQPGRPGGE